MAATIKAPVIFTATDRVSAILSRMSRSISGFAAKASVGIARVEHRFNRLMAPIKRVASQLGALGVIGAGFLAMAVFTSITDFETGLVGVSKTTGIVDDDLKKLGNQFIELSDSMRGVSTESLLAVGQTAGQLGVTGSENILKFAKTMAMLEKASDISGEEGASSIARLLTITGEGPGVIDQFASAIVGLGNSSAATESEILSVASEVARGTAAYGLQAKEILGLSTALKSLDVRPEAAGTAVAKVFRGIEMATLKGGKELQNYAKIMGITSDQVVKDFDKNPTKAFTKFVGGLNRISNEGGSVAKSLLDVGLTGETVSKGIIPLATNFDLLTNKLLDSSAEFDKNTAAQNEFDSATRTVNTGLLDVQKSFTNLTLKTATAGSGLESLQGLLFFVSDNMETLVVVAASLVGVFLAMKVAIIVSKVALGAYNIVMGITTALTQNNKRALIGNTIAQGAYRVAMVAGAIVTGVFSAAQWVLNVAMAANPVGLIIAGIIILIAIVTAIIVKYDEWGAALSFILGPIGLIINIIQSFRRNWEMVKDAFSTGGILGGLKAIGLVLLDSLLMPMQQLLEMISKIPGLSGIAGAAAAKIASIREGLGVNTGETGAPAGSELVGNTETIGPVLPSTNQASSQQTTESIKNSSVSIDVRDKGGNVDKVTQDGNEIPINMGNTVGAF